MGYTPPETKSKKENSKILQESILQMDIEPEPPKPFLSDENIYDILKENGFELEINDTSTLYTFTTDKGHIVEIVIVMKKDEPEHVVISIDKERSTYFDPHILEDSSLFIDGLIKCISNKLEYVGYRRFE